MINNKESFKKQKDGDNIQKYGEFISSYFAWIPISKQKERAEELEVLGEKDKNS